MDQGPLAQLTRVTSARPGHFPLSIFPSSQARGWPLRHCAS